MSIVASLIEVGIFILLLAWVAWAMFYPVRRKKKNKQQNELK